MYHNLTELSRHKLIWGSSLFLGSLLVNQLFIAETIFKNVEARAQRVLLLPGESINSVLVGKATALWISKQ